LDDAFDLGIPVEFIEARHRLAEQVMAAYIGRWVRALQMIKVASEVR